MQPSTYDDPMRWKFTVILEPEEDGGFSVSCPVLQGCVSQGDDLPEALENIREAIGGILEVRKKHHIPAPQKETPELIAEEIRETLKARAEDGRPLLVETRIVEVEAGVAV